MAPPALRQWQPDPSAPPDRPQPPDRAVMAAARRAASAARAAALPALRLWQPDATSGPGTDAGLFCPCLGCCVGVVVGWGAAVSLAPFGSCRLSAALVGTGPLGLRLRPPGRSGNRFAPGAARAGLPSPRGQNTSALCPGGAPPSGSVPAPSGLRPPRSAWLRGTLCAKAPHLPVIFFSFSACLCALRRAFPPPAHP